MLVCKFLKDQGLGNQLWNYVSIKSIAKEIKTDFGVMNYDFFKGKEFIKIKDFVTLENSDFQTYTEKLIFDKKNNYVSSDFDKYVYELRGDWILEGLFQSEEYIRNVNLKDNLTINPNQELPEDVCILNIRGGEYKKHKDFILPKKYWERAIGHMRSKFGARKFIIVSDDRAYSNYLFPELEIISGDIEECYKMIYSSTNVIVSNSSFSYFPIKSSMTQKNVIAPFNWARYNSKSNMWCSPCNCYEGWEYLDHKGFLHYYESAKKNALKTTVKYNNYPAFNPEVHKLSKPLLYKLIPPWLKNMLLKILSKLFPSTF